jgi:hypothetical protein
LTLGIRLSFPEHRHCVAVPLTAGANRRRGLIRDHGTEAYREARERERDVNLTDGTTHAGSTPAHWRGVALIVARMTGKRVGLDTAMRMLKRGDE